MSVAEKEIVSRCPVCGQPVRAARLGSHMRKAHPEPSGAGRSEGRPRHRLSHRSLFLAAGIVLVLVFAGTAYYVISSRVPEKPSSAPRSNTDTRTIPTAWVSMETESGGMLIALFGNETPISVSHFLELAAADFYNGTIFHVAIKDVLIAGGGYLSNLSQKLIPVDPKTGRIPSIPLEINPVMKNTIGTLGMIHNSTDPDTAVTEFYINLADNPSLDKNAANPGFAVFGQVLSGLDVAAGIGNLTTSARTTPGGVTLGNVPVKPVLIRRVVILTSGSG